MTDLNYPGKELSLFSQANRWKSYWTSRITQHIGRSVLEVGAGIGSNTNLLCKGDILRWVCLEPDHQLAENMRNQLPLSQCEVLNGTIKDLSTSDLFDTILYIDVLEHIENDKAEIGRVINHLTPAGKIIILSPAHNSLYSAFDRAIGHYRRYNTTMLKRLFPGHLKLIQIEYLDSLGLILSLSNRWFLKNPSPSKKQIEIWDSIIIPCSWFLDKLIRYRMGKSILAVWQYDKQPDTL